MSHLRRNLAIAILMIGLVLRPAAAHDPILLIHGYHSSSAIFSPLVAWLRLAGREVVALDLPGQDNVVNATFIRDQAGALGWSRVDLVMHSMGGLAGRYLIKELGGSTLVGAYVSLATPQHGLGVACLLATDDGGQMCPDGLFLTDLNRGDETPGPTAWSTIYSRDDRVVPEVSAGLGGGACWFEVAGLGHDGLVRSPSITLPIILAALDNASRDSCPAGGVFHP